MEAYIKDDFKGLLDYRQWVEQTLANPEVNYGMDSYFSSEQTTNRINSQGRKWYGQGISFKDLQSGITEYKRKDIIDSIYQKVNHAISSELTNAIQVQKIKFNPYGLGLFSFDRAAMGMYRLKEYYSYFHNRSLDKSEVNFSTNPISLMENGTTVWHRWEEKPDGRPKIRTTSKKVYAYFPKSAKNRKSVELVMVAGGHSGITAEQLLYTGVSAIIVAQLLETARVKTKISILLGSSPDQYSSTFYGSLIPAKHYDENLDINLLALLSSDPAFFRWDGFKALVASYDHFQRVIPDTFGMALTKERMFQVLDESGFAEGKGWSENRFYIAGTYSETEAVQEITSIVNEIAKRLNS